MQVLDRQLGTGIAAGLGEQPGHVHGHGTDRDAQPVGDLPVGQTLGDQRPHLPVLTDAPAGAPVAGEVATGAGVALVVGTAWLAGTALLLEQLAAAGRRSGSIEFAD